MAVFRWIRVSDGKNDKQQAAILEQAGYGADCPLIALHSVSGGKGGRAAIAAEIEALPADSIVVAVRIERLGREIVSCLANMQAAEERGVLFHFVEQPFLNTDAAAPAMLAMQRSAILMAAQLWLAERSRKAQIAWDTARSEGRNAGRGEYIAAEVKEAILERIEAGETPYSLAKEYGIAIPTVYGWRRGLAGLSKESKAAPRHYRLTDAGERARSKDKAYAAMALLAAGKTQKEAAIAIGVAEKTLCRWVINTNKQTQSRSKGI